MSILTDIRTAASAYAANITTSISNPVPDVPTTINPPDEGFSYTLTATNAGSPDGIQVTNVRYHLSVTGAGVTLLVPPAALALARSVDDPAAATLVPGAAVTAMFLYPVSLDGQSLAVGESDSLVGLRGQAGSAAGVATMSVHVHVDPDLAALFPNNRVNNSATRTVNVV
jgi:hypothetical protein